MISNTVYMILHLGLTPGSVPVDGPDNRVLPAKTVSIRPGNTVVSVRHLDLHKQGAFRDCR
jgi:hypothetical protein